MGTKRLGPLAAGLFWGGLLASPCPGAAEPPAPPVEVVQGAAVMGATSPIIKVLREPGTLDTLKEGETLYIFTEKGEAVTSIAIKNVFSDEIHSEPIDEGLAARIRDSGTILVFANLPEYGDFIKAYLDGGEAAFRGFLSAHPRGPLSGEAQKVLDGLVYRPYKLKGTVEAFDEFIHKNPDNIYVEKAVVRRDTLQYQPFKAADLIGSYRRFIQQYPANRFVPEAQQRLKDILRSFEEVSLDQLAKASASLKGRKVKFHCYLHSILPIFVSGASVGRKTPLFSSPRPGTEYLNLQVEGAGFILWKLFISRDDADLVHAVQTLDRTVPIKVYGQVFSNDGNSPWVDVLDLETGQE